MKHQDTKHTLNCIYIILVDSRSDLARARRPTKTLNALESETLRCLRKRNLGHPASVCCIDLHSPPSSPFTSYTMAKGGKRGVRVTRNPELVPGVRRYGATASAKRSATYKHSKKGLGKSTAHVAPKRADKMDGKFYAADDTKVALRSHKGAAKTAKLRKSIRAGTVVIVLAGRFRGKRVIVLKQLESGLLLVTGQYTNGRSERET